MAPKKAAAGKDKKAPAKEKGIYNII